MGVFIDEHMISCAWMAAMVMAAMTNVAQKAPDAGRVRPVWQTARVCGRLWVRIWNSVFLPLAGVGVNTQHVGC